MKHILENYCWSRQYSLIITGSCGGEEAGTKFIHKKEERLIDGFKIILLCLCIEILVLSLPFIFWSHMDKQQNLRKLGLEIKKIESLGGKSAHLCNFVLKYLNCQRSYVKMFLFFEFLNLVFSIISFVFVCVHWKITPNDIFVFFFKEECGRISDLFPLQTGCTYEQNSIIPGMNDSLETACFLNMNEVYQYVIACLYVWLSILLVFGVVNFIFRLLQIFVRQFRVISLKHSAGSFTINAKINLIVRNLSFSDYFIIENLTQHVDHEVFSDFCNAILEELCPSVPEIDNLT